MAAVHAVLRVVAAAGLAVDAWVHASLAGRYDGVAASISEGTLFRVEAGAASLAALLVLAWRRPLGDLFAWLTAAAGLAALVAYRYWNIGAHGPLPDMYEPIWFTDKVRALAGQALALLALTPLLAAAVRTRRRRPATED